MQENGSKVQLETLMQQMERFDDPRFLKRHCVHKYIALLVSSIRNMCSSSCTGYITSTVRKLTIKGKDLH